MSSHRWILAAAALGGLLFATKSSAEPIRMPSRSGLQTTEFVVSMGSVVGAYTDCLIADVSNESYSTIIGDYHDVALVEQERVTECYSSITCSYQLGEIQNADIFAIDTSINEYSDSDLVPLVSTTFTSITDGYTEVLL
jgi:hypothetical protein